MSRVISTLVLVFSIVLVSYGQSEFWNPLSQSVFSQEKTRIYKPETAQAFSLNYEAFVQKLNASPMEFSSKGQVISIPMPDGKYRAFEFFESPIMQPSLRAKYAHIKTFSARAVDDHGVQGRFDITGEGFHGYILGLGSPVIIDPIFKNDNQLYQVFLRKDLHDRNNPENAFVCDVDVDMPDVDDTKVSDKAVVLTETDAITLRTYRLVIATTFEYSDIYQGTKETVMDEVIKVINRINTIVERDFAIRFELVDGTDELFFLEESDPFTNGDTGMMIGENPGVVASKFGFGDYDIGHVLGTNAGGLAEIRSICGNGKARGVTSAGSNQGDQFYVDYVAHEMGHQLGSNHTFNNCSGFAGGNENAGTAYEPGSGSTIMSYSGICGSNNIQFDSDPFYHVSSLIEITNYMINGGGNCGEKTETQNHFPVAEIPTKDGFFIPKQTAFLLEGIGTDEDGDELTYSWEQFDLGPLSPLGFPIGNAPIFRHIAPDEKDYRFCPKLQTIFSSSVDEQEVIPTYSRDLTFQFVVRDNHPGFGSAAWKKIAFKVTEDAGPFGVTMPGFSDNKWEVGEYAEVRWLVANTDKMPVNCQLVNIRLIQGYDYEGSILLAQNVSNNGLAYVEVPDMIADGYHIIVEAADNIFLDASSAPHKIVSATEERLSAGISNTGLKMCTPTTEKIEIGVVGLSGYSEEVSISLIGDWQASADISLEATTLNTGEKTNLVIDLENVTDFDPIDLQVVVVGPGMDSIKMDVHIDIVDFDFSLLSTVDPADGDGGVPIFPTLNWAELNNFESFHVQMASSPSFESDVLLFDKQYATGESIVTNTGLEINTDYYWRVKTKNECGESPWTLPSAFSTIYVNCTTFEAQDVPIIISTNTPGTETSIITIEESGTISDINIKNINGTHKYFGDLALKIIAPTGESAKLVTKKCGNISGDFNWTFDDASTQNNPCTHAGVLKPEEPIGIFEGLSTQGDWKLEVTDDVVGSGGKLNGWGIELCSDATPSAPHIVNNNLLNALGESDKNIPMSLLLVEDDDNTAEELRYTLVVAPEHGQLRLDGSSLHLGERFTQEEITSGKLLYRNFGGSEIEDSFFFSVFDGAGGMIPVTKFNIAVTPAGLEPLASKDFQLYPNPTTDWVQLRFSELIKGSVEIQVVDITGRLLMSFDKRATDDVRFSTKTLKAGIYLVRVMHEGKLGVVKLTVLK